MVVKVNADPEIFMPMPESHAVEYNLMSDWQRRLEAKTLGQYETALANFRSMLQDVQTGSVLVKVDLAAFDNFVHDELPDVKTWAALVEDAA